MIQTGSLITSLVLGSTMLSAPLTADGTSTDAESTDKLPVVYTVPFEGQMGTDIHEDLVEAIIEDVQVVQPDLIVFRINSADIGTNKHLPTFDRKEMGKYKFDEYIKMAQDLHNSLGHIDKVVWVEDCVGLSSLMAVAFNKIYMSEGARLYGLQSLHDITQGWADEDVREKMEAAREGQGRAFFELGGRGKYARILGDAMMDPEAKLSANFVGREVIWLPHTDGMWMVDDSNEQVANFNATSALDTMLIEDTVGSLEDLVFVLGYREYEHNTQGDEIAENYTKRWRTNYEKCKTTYEDYQADRGLGTSNDPRKVLMAKRKMLEEVVKIMKRYSAVERRMNDEYRISINSLEFQIDTLKDQLRQLKENGSRGSRGGRSGGTRGGGGRGL